VTGRTPLATLAASRRRGLLVAWGIGVAATLASVGATTLKLWSLGSLRWPVFLAVLVAAAGLCLARAAWVREERLAWLVIGLGVCSHAGGWGMDFYYYGGVAPVPSWSDALWLSAYLGCYPGLVLLGRHRFGRRGLSVWLDGLVGGLALGAIAAGTALQPSLASLSESWAAVVGSAYPVADIVLLTCMATTFAASGWRPDRSGKVLVSGLLILVVVDTVFAFASVHGGWFAGQSYDPLWGTAMLLVGTAAWLPSRRLVRTDASWRQLMFPIGFATLATAVLVYGQSHGLNPVAIVLAVCALGAVMLRMALLMRETAALALTRRLSLTDDLTGLGNRRAFTAEAEAAIAEGSPFALLMIDLDQFKELNDTLGHHVGDDLLRGIGPRLAATVRPGDLVARLGGDEFGVLLRGADERAACVVCDRMRESLGRPFDLAGISLHVGASIGVALHPDHADDAGQLLRHADVAMYEAKRSRGGFAVYASEGDHHSRDRLALAGQMRAALARDELALHYQPLADLASGELRGVEALVRWRHPERGLLAPGAFLPAIEHTDLMRELSHRVLSMALVQAAAWLAEGRTWRVSVNLSATDLLDRRLVDDVAALLRRNRVPPSHITLEVTESVLMTDPQRAMVVLGELRKLGVRLALDDFGTGWSSLTHLQRLPVDEIKIDRSFVAAMAAETRAAAIVSSTVDLAHAVGLRVVAEGIEDEATWSRLRAVGCDAAQGYYLSRPLPAAELEAGAAQIAQRARAASAATPVTA
jgi:diguanylate cyclase